MSRLRSNLDKEHLASLTEFGGFTQNDLWNLRTSRGIAMAFQKYYRLVVRSLTRYL